MRTFFICGTPRSRTAWLANLLTTDNTYCFHELLAEYSDMANIERCFIETGKQIVGNSDSGNTLLIDKLKAKFPTSKIVVIKRDKAEVVKSLVDSKYVNADNVNIDYSVGLFMNGIKHIESNFDCISFNYEDLLKVDCCKEIYEYCTGLSFDYKRWELLANLNIQVEKEFALKRIKDLVDNKRILEFIKN